MGKYIERAGVTGIKEVNGKAVITASLKEQADRSARANFPGFVYEGSTTIEKGITEYTYVPVIGDEAPQAAVETPAPAADKPSAPAKTKAEQKRLVKITAGSKAAATKKANAEYPDYEFDKELKDGVFRYRLIEATMVCTRKVTEACQKRDGVFEPKEFNKKQNYRVCKDCQSALNKKYRPAKADAAGA